MHAFVSVVSVCFVCNLCSSECRNAGGKKNSGSANTHAHAHNHTHSRTRAHTHTHTRTHTHTHTCDDRRAKRTHSPYQLKCISSGLRAATQAHHYKCSFICASASRRVLHHKCIKTGFSPRVHRHKCRSNGILKATWCLRAPMT